MTDTFASIKRMLMQALFRLLITLLLTVKCNNTFSQITFQYAYAINPVAAAYSVLPMVDGGYILSGGNGYSFEINLIRTNSTGQILWSKNYSASTYAFGEKIQATDDGGFVIIGYIYSSTLELKGFLMKVDSNGSLLWSKAYGGAGPNFFTSISTCNDNGFIICGNRGEFPAQDVLLVKTDSLGNLEWSAAYGGSKEEEAFSIQQTSDSGYIVAGETFSFGVDYFDGLLLKTDKLGNLEWLHTYGGDEGEYFYAVREMPDSGFVVAGTTGSFTYYPAGYLLKVDEDGNLVWSKTYSKDGTMGFNDLDQTDDDGFVLTGDYYRYNASADAILLKSDSSGNVEWFKDYYETNYDDEAFSVRGTSDKGYVLTGFTESFGNNAPLASAYLIKTDSTGNSGCNVEDDTVTVESAATIVGIFDSTVSCTVISTDTTVTANSVSISTTEICIATTLTQLDYKNDWVIFPNPLSDVTTIVFTFSKSEKASLEIFDLQGRLIRTLADEVMSEGAHTLTWDARDEKENEVSDGIYFLQMQTANESKTIPLSVIK